MTYREDGPLPVRMFKPICTICRRPFRLPLDYLIWQERVEDRTLFYHDSCASDMVKASAQCRDVSDCRKPEYMMVEFKAGYEQR
jgi:hypothetical protein